ncbi:hypothetical protein QUF54_01155 [Candidatus Marithioploca araucensis]|uniref:Glycosyltransferase RgtA/B/C/D-like domain-containing protein n=1 Tax=Candidatus Marithioploca araucensis TaxID=70273 RepID=A0ABT7VQL2_9GAMM|nr:hypothetical protein [Candidatus Marithioploca araucensis]
MKSLYLKITNALLLLVLTSVLGILLWGIDKGFDITDEGFAMLLYQYPQEYTFTGLTFHILGSKLFAWLEPGIITYRFLRLIFSIFVPMVFSWGFWVWLRKNNFVQNDSPVNFITLSIFLILGCLAYYASSSYIASYNAINGHLILIATGMLLFILSDEQIFPAKKLLLISVGIIIALQFFVKFSSAISFLIVFVPLLLVYFRRLMIIVYLVIGIMIGGLLYFLFFQDYSSWLSGSVESIKLASTTDTYNPIHLLSQYVSYFSRVSQHLILAFLPLFIGLFLSVRLLLAYQAHQLSKEHYILNILIGAAIFLYGFFIYQGYHLELFKGSRLHSIYWEKSAHIYFVVLFACLIVLLALLWNNIRGLFSIDKLNRLGVILLLIAIPFIGMVGTNNVSSTAFMPYLTAWFALIVIFVLYLNRCVKTPLISSILIITIAFIVLSKTIDGVIYSHYRLADIRINQTETVEGLKALEGIKVDSQTKQFFEKLNHIIKKKTDFKEGDPILAAYDMPGIVYALGGISPGRAWYLVEKKSFQKSNCEALSRSKLSNLDRTLLLVQWKMYQEFDICMKQNFKKWGISSMKKVGEIKSPYTHQVVQIFILT